jgi:hypothetical protein
VHEGPSPLILKPSNKVISRSHNNVEQELRRMSHVFGGKVTGFKLNSNSVWSQVLTAVVVMGFVFRDITKCGPLKDTWLHSVIFQMTKFLKSNNLFGFILIVSWASICTKKANAFIRFIFVLPSNRKRDVNFKLLYKIFSCLLPLDCITSTQAQSRSRGAARCVNSVVFCWIWGYYNGD